ncbi:MAG: alkyl hydroperoxide reductase [Euryarchaeota archaeon]|nr:alkyl hydroperoxide reductase [Euryarchaeota archaeon]|tara:strand:- start:1168 stop:1656 length:489 start_codon:yes stop_codon:yes gene_type:complete
MKHLYFALILLVGMSTSVIAQNVASVNLKNLEGMTVNPSDLVGKGHPTVICFWATWCSPCKRELNNYMDYYVDWQDETGVEIIAVSIDDSRSMSRVAPFVTSSGWEYEVLLDPGRDFARAMQVINVPHTFLVDGEGKVVWTHNNYSEGDEEELYEELLKLVE